LRSDDEVSINPKTGFTNEPWHLRYVGVDEARRFHEAWLASGPGTPNEIALEQWLRARYRLPGDIDLPVCDGCNCGACATLADDADKTPCGEASLRIDGQGAVVQPREQPRILGVRVTEEDFDRVAIEVLVHSPAHTPTQPPVMGENGPSYAGGSSFEALGTASDGAIAGYRTLAGAWRVGIEPVPPGPIRWPWRASLAKPELEHIWNLANALLPANAGDHTVRVRIASAPGTRSFRVSLLEGEAEHGTFEITRPASSVTSYTPH
jgi:hypothetical protein